MALGLDLHESTPKPDPRPPLGLIIITNKKLDCHLQFFISG